MKSVKSILCKAYMLWAQSQDDDAEEVFRGRPGGCQAARLPPTSVVVGVCRDRHDSRCSARKANTVIKWWGS